MVTLEQHIEGWGCGLVDPFECVLKRTVQLEVMDGSRMGRCETITRINGELQCPGCGLHWPMIEETDCWTEDAAGVWRSTDFGPGTAECLVCDRIFIDTFEGCFELLPPVRKVEEGV